MERVAAFIDGFNLYHAIVELQKPHLKWVNLWTLTETFIKRRSQRLDKVYYFSPSRLGCLIPSSAIKPMFELYASLA